MDRVVQAIEQDAVQPSPYTAHLPAHLQHEDGSPANVSPALQQVSGLCLLPFTQHWVSKSRSWAASARQVKQGHILVLSMACNDRENTADAGQIHDLHSQAVFVHLC